MNRSIPACLVTLALLLGAGVAHAEKLYKWVDEHGKIQYSDKPPLQQTPKGTSELNKQGLTIRKNEGYQEDDPKGKEAERARLREEQERLRRDKALVNTFSNTKEIDIIRDRNIEQLEAAIASNKLRQQAADKRLGEYRKQQERYARKKQASPADLLTDIENTEREIKTLEQTIVQKQGEIEVVKQKAEVDKKRLVELRGAAAAK
ncbi:DUF4124 domain-containing protein [Parachitinimonas caeni]|uniref:DUF4124 domain-containing protein n=1 Tax=Parachitinimonas caeni TaxID=3031301 RepID=A0ABT7DRI2_9NEIS|nr:DUF4124 domain-containing protein [Parachitinimonas caeni]MDK2122672.1 DUF4124 domain-containing protein [Parachitinimonas caeni]